MALPDCPPPLPFEWPKNLTQVELMHAGNYSHLLLDSLYTLFLELRRENLMATPICLTLTHYGEAKDVTMSWVTDIVSCYCNLAAIRLNSIETSKTNLPSLFSSDKICDTICKTLRARFKENVLNENLATELLSDDLADFVNRIVREYDLEETKQDPRLVTICNEKNREILNRDEIIDILKGAGFNVETVAFDVLSHREQVKQMRRSRYILGSYGSDLVNAIFLPQNSTKTSGVIICWPNPDVKQIWSSCIIHCAILAMGHVVHELDKGFYDQQDTYLQQKNFARVRSDTYDQGNILFDVAFSVDTSQLRTFAHSLYTNALHTTHIENHAPK
jgi:hypothetical protein